MKHQRSQKKGLAIESPASPPRRRTRGRGNGEGSLFKRDKGRGTTGPWYFSWYDERGKRREACAKTTDRATAARMLAKRVEEVAKRRDGIVSVAEAMIADAGLKPLSVHLDDYVNDCIREGQDDQYIASKTKAIKEMIEGGAALRLTDLTSDLLMRHLAGLKREGLSAGWCNYVRRSALAFANWCVEEKRMPLNLMAQVSVSNVDRDRRYIRRPFTDDELDRLLTVAEKKGRKAWYLTAALAGLRFGDLGRLMWADVNFDDATLLIRNGKSGKDDLLALHPDLAIELQARKAELNATEYDRVFPTLVSSRTRLNDLLVIGLAERVFVKNADGLPKLRWHGKGRSRREVPVTKVVAKADGQGRVVDLHALRTTLATKLARSGTPAQVAQKIMRHADYRTTLKHYTALELQDSAAALAGISVPNRSANTAIPAKNDTAVETAVGPATATLEGANACDAVRENGAPIGGGPMRNRPVKPGDSATACESVLLVADKRRTGVEPATFSLGS
jgi:integrase